MRIRTGLGPDDWSPNQPDCYARVSGHGGRMVGDFIPSPFTPQGHRAGRSWNRTTEQRLADNERRRRARAVLNQELLGDPRPNTPRCDHPLARGGICARHSGHSRRGNGAGHRSRAALDYDNTRRRTR